MTPRLLFIPALALLLTACDIPGLGPDPRIAQREAEGKAIGGGCRYALRGIEECYRMNPKVPKTAVFEGWREMDQYMRENKIEGQPPAPESGDGTGGATPKPAETDKKSAPEARPRVTDKKAPCPGCAGSRPPLRPYTPPCSNTAMLSTCAVCGNMFTTPAAVQR